EYIKNSVIGFGIVLFSYIFLSLIGITEIRLPDISVIAAENMPGMMDLIIINGVEMTVEQAMSALPPERRGNVSEFNNAACPKGQSSFQVFFTNYYTPEFGDKGSYMPTFWCNIAMQCSCPKGINKGASCGLKSFAGGYHPCNEFSSDTPYCNHCGNGKAPVGNYTIAGSKCFKYGCKFNIKGAPGTYEVMDRGSAIKGTHMDLYVGKGKSNFNKIAGVYTITLQNPGQCF
ncbi:MAG: 3D domain-containing protein, partial [Candidatus Parcubacteria bacterium]|nr:3D domain-containing protein [Candidatus Parcubacteria bacterium]